MEITVDAEGRQHIQRPLIPLYKVRRFGEKISDTFAFIGENIRPLFKYITYLLLPLCLFQALAFNGLMSNYFSTIGNLAGGNLDNDNMFFSEGMQGMLGNFILTMLFYTVGSLILVSLVYALMYLYEHREGRLSDITFSEIRSLLTRNIKRGVILTLVGLVIALLFFAWVFLMVMASPYMFVVAYIVGLLIIFPLSLAVPIYLFEHVNVLEAYFKAIRLGFKTFGGVLAVVIVLSLIVGILQMITTLPWEIAMIFKTGLGLDSADNAFTSSVGYSFMTYILGVIQCYGAYLVYAILFVGIAYQYGHASEKIDRFTVENDIEHFETL